MPVNELENKEAYYKQQELLDGSDEDVSNSNRTVSNAERALDDFDAMPPPPEPATKRVHQPGSFPGPTPKEVRQKVTRRLRDQEVSRRTQPGLIRSATAHESDTTQSFPATKPSQRPSSNPTKPRGKPRGKSEKSTSMPSLTGPQQIPFYKCMGAVPRELKNGKFVKLADNIKLDPEEKQLLKGKVIYFFPNDDVSLARRRRLHKIVQLGAAWAKEWRDDVTFVIVDDDNHTYSQLLRNINKAGLPRKVALVKFDPYIPQSIALGMLLDHTAGRFAVRGAPSSGPPSSGTQPTAVLDSQISLQIKPSQRQLAEVPSEKTDTPPSEYSASFSPAEGATITSKDIVEDSFIQPSSPGRKGHLERGIPVDDPLSAAIQQTKAIAHLPLDEDEEGDSRPSSSGGQDEEEGTGDEDRQPSPKRAKISSYSYAAAPKPRNKIKQNTFQCMDPVGRSSSQNPNSRTIEVLDQMCKYYDQMNDQWRTLAYRKAVNTLRRQTTKISTAEEAAALPFIGSRLADKIEEIVLTDRLRRLDSTRDDPTDKILRLFLGIYGVGLSQASKWMQAGHRTLADLVTKAKLTDSQTIGIEHYYDFTQRVPRAEVEAHGKVVKDALEKLDPGFQVTIMGSYRRGAPNSGDIDIIITKPGASIATLREVVFQRLIPSLLKSGFLKVKLATSSRFEDGTKWLGASCLPSSTTWRRLDLLLVPEDELGAALLYFTGNDIFNRSIRLLASKKGMRLNQRGLYKDVIRGKNREKLTEGTLVEGRDEKKIFEILGVPWREPTERVC